MRYDPRFPSACAAAAAAAPHLTSADIAATVAAVLAETDRILEDEADTHDIVEVPGCERVLVEDIVPGETVWSPANGQNLYVNASPRYDDEILLAYAGGIDELFVAGERVHVVRSARAHDADLSDWADDERGVA